MESVLACRWFREWNCFTHARFQHAERSMSEYCRSERFPDAEKSLCSVSEKIRHAERSKSSFCNSERVPHVEEFPQMTYCRSLMSCILQRVRNAQSSIFTCCHYETIRHAERSESLHSQFREAISCRFQQAPDMQTLGKSCSPPPQCRLGRPSGGGRCKGWPRPHNPRRS